MSEAMSHYDFSEEPLRVEGDPKYKGVDPEDLSTYLNDKYLQKYLEDKNAQKGTQVRLANLHNELIEGYTEIYAVKSDGQLRDIVSSEQSKPWEKEAALAVLHDRMRNNAVKLQKVKEKPWHAGKKEEEEAA